MADIRAAFGTSHAFALLPPAAWNGFRAQNQAVYELRFRHIPPDRPQLLEEARFANDGRYRRITAALDEIRSALTLDALSALWLSAMKTINSERTSQ